MAMQDQFREHGHFGLEDAVVDGGQGRSRAVPPAAVTHLWRRMFLSLSQADASGHCFPPLL